MVASKLHAIPHNDSLMIQINGPMDLRLASALSETCQDIGVAYDRYIVDFRNVSIVRDSGLALLLMLKHSVNRGGGTLHVINGNSDLMYRCFKLGIRPA